MRILSDIRLLITIISLLTIISCTSRTKDESQSIKKENVELPPVIPPTEDDYNYLTYEPSYNYLTYDSILLNCEQRLSLNLNDLIARFGIPDSIVKYNPNDDFYGEPYSLVKYKDMQFRLFDNDIVQIRRLTFSATENKICYKDLELDKETTIQNLEKLFTLSFNKRETISTQDRQYIAMRFFTSQKPTDSQWIMLFNDSKLEHLDYFDGND